MNRHPAPQGPVVEWFPLLGSIRSYGLSLLRRDVVAGLVLVGILVPAGMGYAVACGLPPIYGLYATIVPLVAYALVGPSRVLILGPDSSLVPLIAATILPLAAGDPARAVAFAAALAVMAGLLCLVAGLARFGFLTDLLSMPIRYGYLNGIALTIVVSQLPRLFGFSASGSNLLSDLAGFLRGLAAGKTNPAALAVGVAVLATVLGMRRVAPRVPAIPIAVAGAMVAGAVLRAAGIAIPVVGELPRGLPGFVLPHVAARDLVELLPGAVGIAVVAFADTSLLSRTFAIRGRYSVDPNRELVALGVANIACGFFQGFAVSASSTRTPVAEAAGARTQVAGLVGAAAIVGLLLLAPGLFRTLPSSALAAVVIASSLRLVEVRAVARLARVRPGEFVLSMTALFGVAFLGVIRGVAVAIGVALLSFIRRAWRPHTAELVRVRARKGYHDAGRHPEGRRVPGLVLYRFDAPLFFANADFFKEEVIRLVARADPPARWVVVTAEPITDVDATAAEMLDELVSDLRQRGVVLRFAELKGVVRERLQAYGFVDKIGLDAFYPTIGEAVRSYVTTQGVPWVDWEEGGPLAGRERRQESE